MNIVNETLGLSAWQRQVIKDMGIDAWYLTPFQHAETIQDKANNLLINELVGSLKAPLEAFEEQSSSPLPVVSSQPKIEKSYSNSPLFTRSKGNRHVLQQPVSIHMDTQGNTNLPEDKLLSFQMPLLSKIDWQQVCTEGQMLADEVQQPYCSGSGIKQADECFIFSAPDNCQKDEIDNNHQGSGLTATEHRLLCEILNSVDIYWDKVYRTHLLKHATSYGQAPDLEILNKNLSILATELALVTPKRIWLVGALSCHTLMQTKAALSLLMKDKYRLLYKGASGHNCQAEIVCLPSLDYLLAMPAEKSFVWKTLKKQI